ncbi:MAG: saccharopine dehydrogenase C-terminal domain-containing protein, partial [Thermoplasmata archaeon]
FYTFSFTMIIVLGYGMIGSIVAKELSLKDEVVVVDKRNIDDFSTGKFVKGDIFDFPELITKADVVVSTLPGNVSYPIISKLLSKGKKIVDVSFMPENAMDLNDMATKQKALLIPDAGYAPGLTNIISAYFYKKYKPESIEIYVGGLPQEKVPPLDYAITWSVSGLIDEYNRPARIVKNKKIVSVDPLEDIEKRMFPGIGDLEAFYSDGLRTLLFTLKDVDMFEKTYRYPGHLQKIKFLRDMGYFSETEGCSPRIISEQLFEKKLKMKIEDLSILEVRAKGKINKEIRYVEYYDRYNNLTSMSKMTGFPAVVLTELLIDNKIQGTGVKAPEYFGFDEPMFNEIMSRLKKRGINLEIS